MFTIKKTDTSYRFLNKWCDTIPRGFCEYYRKVILVSMLLFLAGYCIAWTPISLISSWMGWDDYNIPIHNLETALFRVSVLLGLFPLGMCIILGVGYSLYTFAETIEDRKRKRMGDNGFTPKRQSVIKTWIKAKKEKMCPMIEFEE